MYARKGPGTKMHHKFALLGGRTAPAGRYGWTVESEEENCESLLVLRAPEDWEIYPREFGQLWAGAKPPSS